MPVSLTNQVRLGFSMGWRIWTPNEVRFYAKTLAHSYFIFVVLKSKFLKKKLWVVNYSIIMGIKKYFVFIEFLQFGLKSKEERTYWKKLMYIGLIIRHSKFKKKLINNGDGYFRLTAIRRYFKKQKETHGCNIKEVEQLENNFYNSIEKKPTKGELFITNFIKNINLQKTLKIQDSNKFLKLNTIFFKKIKKNHINLTFKYNHLKKETIINRINSVITESKFKNKKNPLKKFFKTYLKKKSNILVLKQINNGEKSNKCKIVYNSINLYKNIRKTNIKSIRILKNSLLINLNKNSNKSYKNNNKLFYKKLTYKSFIATNIRFKNIDNKTKKLNYNNIMSDMSIKKELKLLSITNISIDNNYRTKTLFSFSGGPRKRFSRNLKRAFKGKNITQHLSLIWFWEKISRLVSYVTLNLKNNQKII